MKNILLSFIFITSTLISMAQHTKIIAHRGAWKNTQVPQNSIAALQKAIDLKVWGSEFDVCYTKDNVLVVNHNNDYEGIDVATNDYATLIQKPLANGEKLPTAEEYMIAGLKQKHTKMIFEIKANVLGKERTIEATEKSYELVKKLKGLKQTVFISFSYDACLHLKKLDKKARVQYLGNNKSPIELYNDGITEMDFNLSVFKSKPQYFEEAKKRKMVTNAWTVNKADDMRYLIDNKIDCITTDEPELLQTLLK